MTATTTEATVRAATSGGAAIAPISSAAAPPRPSWIHRLGFDRFSALYLWAAFMIFFGITQTSTFLDWNGSIKLVLTEKAVVGILAIAFLIPLATDTFDLSVGHMMSFSLVIVTALSKAGRETLGESRRTVHVGCEGVGSDQDPERTFRLCAVGAGGG